MKKRKSILLYVALLGVLATLTFQRNISSAISQSQPTATSKEDAYRLNNIGVALLEQFKYKEAADAFRQALKVEPKLRLAQINLSIALFNLPDLAGATREAQTALTLAADAPQPPYILGLIAKSQSRVEEAVVQFQRVLKIDPNDVGTNVNLGQIYSQQRKYPEAIAAFRLALAAEPYNATALYNLGQALVRSGQREEGLRAIARFQELRQRGSATTLGNDYLEQGRYAEAVASTGAEAELVDRATPAVKFTLSPNSVGATTTTASRSTTTTTSDPSGFQLTEVIKEQITGAVVLFDFDGDGDLDLFRVAGSQRFLYRNDNGTFTDITDQSTAFSSKLTNSLTGAVAGDFDNDTKPDLLVIGNGIVNLYHNDGGGKFSDVTKAANIPAYPFLASSAAFTDVDHDGDVDIFIAGLADLSQPNKTFPLAFPDSFPGAPDFLLQNDGTGKFSDVTATAGIKAARHAVAVVPTDFNNRRDMDLLIVSQVTPLEMFSNQRDGTFRNVARETGLPGDGRWISVAAGDVNKDGYTDFFLGRVAGVGLFVISDGKEKFKTVPAPAGTEMAHAAQFLDYDNDGLLDCVLLTIKGLHVLRNVGNDWIDVTETAVGASGSVRCISFSAGDIDNDGDTDLVLLSSEGNLIVLRNEGGNKNNSLRITLTGRVSNRNGIGTKVEARAGSLVQKLETSATTPAVAPADISFGLGKRTGVDAVRLLWPSGVVQAETEFPKTANKALPITELDRKPSSCPYLYTWNGERFEFITDFMGGGEMGHLDAPGLYNKPDPVEYVRITNDQLKERDGAYEIRVTNELEEALFADQFQLIAVDHPSDVNIYPNEGLTDLPRPFRLFVTRDARPPLAATDEHGHDVLSRITTMDRTYPDDFHRDRIRGYAEEHTLTLKTAEAPTTSHHQEQIVLLLTGWTDYAWSSDNLAASQARKEMKLPELQVKNAHGEWQTVIDNIGIPVGRPQTVAVDLTGKFLSSSRDVRLVTNMRILWDQVLVAKLDSASRANTTRIDPAKASLRWRGFSSEVTPDGREPYGYDYQRVSLFSPWKVMPGRYTREGDVRELLLQPDDMFVISLPGDEISLSFDARKFPPLPPKWTRTFLLYSDGFSKEMDINSAVPDRVLPLPFHGMSAYPYPSRESYPMTPARQAYMDRYNTRVVTNELLSINSLIKK